MSNQKGVVISNILIWTVVVLVSLGTFGATAVHNGVIDLNPPVVEVTPSVTLINTPSPTPIITQKAEIPTKIITMSPTKAVVINTPVVTKAPLPVLNGADIFNAVNSYRTSRGLSGLSVSDELCKIAESRADYMMANNMAAFKSSGVGAHTGFRDTFNYSGQEIGEDLAANVASTSQTMSTWQNSPPHNALLLSATLEGIQITKGCVATRVKDYGSIVVLEVGDK